MKVIKYLLFAFNLVFAVSFFDDFAFATSSQNYCQNVPQILRNDSVKVFQRHLFKKPLLLPIVIAGL